MDQQFSLRWNNYLNQITDAFGSLRNEEDLIDVTLSCEGKRLKAHKMLLSACSTYFRDIFKDNPCPHPVIVFRDFKYADLKAIVDFIYKGEVNIVQDQLDSFLATAELLEIKGLTDGTGNETNFEEDTRSSLVEPEAIPDVLTQNYRSSTVSSSPQESFVPNLSKPTSPPSKKRKCTPIGHRIPPERKQMPSLNKGRSLPLVPKIEKQEYIEDLTHDEEDMSFAKKTEQFEVLQDPKPDSSLSFNADSNNSTDNLNSEILTMGDALLQEASTSLEGLNQESMQEYVDDDPMDGDVKDAKVKKVTEGQKQDGTESVVKFVSSVLENTIDDSIEDLEEENIVVNKTDKTDVEMPNNYEAGSFPLQSMDVKMALLARKSTIQTNIVDPVLKKQSELQLPKGLSITVCSKEITRANLLLENDQFVESEAALRSEEAKTPVSEDPCGYHQSEVSSGSPAQIVQEEPEMGEEEPEPNEANVPEEEEIEPEFDYYGCETCKTEGKVVDRFSFTHKCPICPYSCFCAHLLKEHMKLIHGWFNVQRRFNQY